MIDNLRSYYNVELSDFRVSERDKRGAEYLMACTDSIINDLVNENSHRRKMMLKMRAMRDGIRDPQEYAYLTDNYGIGNPGELRFTPVVRNRIDAIIGILSTAEFGWKVSIGDSESIQAAETMKTMEVLQKVYDKLAQNIGSVSLVDGVERLINMAVDEIEGGWKNAFEKSANNMVKYYRDDVEVNLKDQIKDLMEDMTAVGECVYRVVCDEYGTLPYPEVLLPENFYIEKRRDQRMYREGLRACYVRYLTLEEALTRYGHLMTRDQKEDLLENPHGHHYLNAREVHELEAFQYVSKDGARRRSDEHRYDNRRYIRVYECEWIANNPVLIPDKKAKKAKMTVQGPDKIQKEEFWQFRYQSTRIGHNVYVNMGQSDFVKRSRRNPKRVGLSFNGIAYGDRTGGEPYSLLWKCKDVQDMTDIMYFHRDNLVANSGVDGSRIDVSTLPDFLGNTMMERLMKVIALKKQGHEPYNGAQNEGGRINAGVSSDFKGGVNGQLLEAITHIINQLDEEASKITGVTPQMMGLIEQRDAVTNVKTGISQASLVLKNLYDKHDMVVKNLLTDLIQVTQVSLEDEDEFQGSFMSEIGYESFKVIPKFFSFTDYNIHVVSSSNEYHKLSEAKQAAISLANTGSIDPGLLIRIIKSDSINEVVRLVDKMSSGGKESENLINKLQQQVDELSKQNEQLTKKLESAKAEDLQIKRDKLNIDKELKLLELRQRAKKDTGDLQVKEEANELKKEIVNLERDQLYLDAENNAREVRNDI